MGERSRRRGAQAGSRSANDGSRTRGPKSEPGSSSTTGAGGSSGEGGSRDRPRHLRSTAPLAKGHGGHVDARNQSGRVTHGHAPTWSGYLRAGELAWCRSPGRSLGSGGVAAAHRLEQLGPRHRVAVCRHGLRGVQTSASRAWSPSGCRPRTSPASAARTGSRPSVPSGAPITLLDAMSAATPLLVDEELPGGVELSAVARQRAVG
jgi:hypothetical protein